MKQIIRKDIFYSKRIPYFYGIILPISSILFFTLDYGIYGFQSIIKTSEITVIGFLAYSTLAVIGMLVMSCAKKIESVFLKYDVTNISIKNSLDLLNNALKIFYGSIISFFIIFFIEWIFLKKVITSTDIVDSTTYFLFSTHMVVLMVIFLALLSILNTRFNYRYKFGYSRICLKFCISDESDETEKLKFLSNGINSYNFFLGKYTNMEFKNTDFIVSKIMSETSLSRKSLIKELDNSFNQGDLGPMNAIKKLLSSNTEGVFVKRQKFSGIKQLIPIIVSIITVLYFGIQIIINFVNPFFK